MCHLRKTKSACLILHVSCSIFTAIGRLCEKRKQSSTKNVFIHHSTILDFLDDGLCVVCDSYVRPCTLVRICDECNYGSYQGRCTICGGPGVSDAYYCKECTICEKDVSCVSGGDLMVPL